MKLTKFTLLLLLIVTSCTISVDILDEDETIDTYITASDLLITIGEDLVNNQVLGTIEATTNKGTLVFSIIDQIPDGAMGINHQTGELYVLDAGAFVYKDTPYIAGTVKIENGNVFKDVTVVITLTEVEQPSLQERLDNGETPIDLYNSNNSFLYGLYGLNYRGGLIFYLDINNGNGMVAAPNDQSTGAPWGCEGINIAGAENSVIGSGQQNTIEILQICMTPGIAAAICDSYSLNGYNDWYLPSLGELDLMFKNLKDKGFGNFSDEWYWSSTEFEDQAVYDNHGHEAAWVINFKSGEHITYDIGIKRFLNRVRAIRNF